MMRRIKYIGMLLAAILFLASCEKDITLDLPQPEDLIIVEGHIETNGFPYVILTKNSPYYSTFYLNDLSNYFLHGANVRVTDGTDTVSLTEITFDTAGVKASVYASFAMKGEAGKTYTLIVDADGKHITAVTTIPESIPLDSIWAKGDIDPDKPEVVRLFCRLTDPPALGQYVRYFTQRNSELSFPGLNSVFDDGVINGTTFDFPLDRGVNRNDTTDFDDYGLFLKGDTITVKWCNIDKAHFDFWRTLEFELGSEGNPFATPTRILSNINGGLGIWGGYASSTKTAIVPK